LDKLLSKLDPFLLAPGIRQLHRPLQDKNRNAAATDDPVALVKSYAKPAQQRWPGPFRFQRVLLVVFHRLLGLCASGADDLVGGAKDLLGAPFGDRRRVKTDSPVEPALDIASAVVSSF
jgi:hypothetical protein